MANALLNIVQKELKEMFRDPRLLIGMILVPLLIFPVMGSVIRVSMEATEASVTSVSAGFMSRDASDGNGTMAVYLYSYLEASGIHLRNTSADNLSAALEECRKNGINILIEIPSNFTECIANGSSARMKLYQMLRNYGIGEGAESSVVLSAIDRFNEYIISARLVSIFPDAKPDELLHPVVIEANSVISGEVKEVSPALVITTIMSTSMAMPVVIMILLLMAGQLAATSVAMEKEQKTLEVLLTMPINRMYLLIGKISGVIVLSIIATASYILGFTYYMSTLTSTTGVESARIDLETLGIVPDFQGYFLMLASLFLAFLAVLSLSVLLGAYTKDVRSAQALLGVLYIPILIPTLILMMAPLEILPPGMQVLIYAIPFSYPILATKALYTHEYALLYAGLIYQLVFTFVVLYIASKFFASEKILTAKIELKKKKVMVED